MVYDLRLRLQMLPNLFNDQVRKRKTIPMQAPNLYPLEVILGDYDLSRSSRPALAKTSYGLDIAEPEMRIQSGLVVRVPSQLRSCCRSGYNSGCICLEWRGSLVPCPRNKRQSALQGFSREASRQILGEEVADADAV